MTPSPPAADAPVRTPADFSSSATADSTSAVEWFLRALVVGVGLFLGLVLAWFIALAAHWINLC